MNFRSLFLVSAVAASFVATMGEAAAEEASAVAETVPVAIEADVTRQVPDDFCSSFIDEAAAAKTAYDQMIIQQSKEEIERKLDELRVQTAELSSWIEKRDAIRADVSDQLVKIYAQMEPVAAAAQIERFTPDLAAELVRRLKPDASAEILSIMDPATAAKLVQVLTLHSPKEKQVGSEVR